MSDLKIVLYKGNRTPRSIALSTRTLYKTLALASVAGFLLFISIGVAIRSTIKANSAVIAQPQTSAVEEPATGSLEEQNQTLKDKVAQLESQFKNQQALSTMPKEIGTKHPALALFSPNVVDKTKDAERVQVKNFIYKPGVAKTPATLSFELHNPKPDAGNQKGYIVVVARTAKNLFVYPDAFNTSGTYLLDFEKGETFNIARFRQANAQFELPMEPKSFQVFMFSREGELIVNYYHEVSK